MNVDGYEPDGTLLADPLGGGLQYRLKPGAENGFRVVPKTDRATVVWRRAIFAIEGMDGEYQGWTKGQLWNGWTMPCFEFSEAQQAIELLTDPKGKFDDKRDSFVAVNSNGEEDIWQGRMIPVAGGSRSRFTGLVLGLGNGSLIFDFP